MRHARADYNRFQDPIPEGLGGIPEDEPVFLLRGQDKYAPAALAAYATAVEEGEGYSEIVKNTREHRAQMVNWQLTHKSKTPDM